MLNASRAEKGKNGENHVFENGLDNPDVDFICCSAGAPATARDYGHAVIALLRSADAGLICRQLSSKVGEEVVLILDKIHHNIASNTGASRDAIMECWTKLESYSCSWYNERCVIA